MCAYMYLPLFDYLAGVELTGTASTMIITTLSTTTFENVDSYYKPGIPFIGQVRQAERSPLRRTPQLNVCFKDKCSLYALEQEDGWARVVSNSAPTPHLPS